MLTQEKPTRVSTSTHPFSTGSGSSVWSRNVAKVLHILLSEGREKEGVESIKGRERKNGLGGSNFHPASALGSKFMQRNIWEKSVFYREIFIISFRLFVPIILLSLICTRARPRTSRGRSWGVFFSTNTNQMWRREIADRKKKSFGILG